VYTYDIIMSNISQLVYIKTHTLPCFGKPEPGEIFIRGRIGDNTQRKDIGDTKEEGRPGGRPETIHDRGVRPEAIQDGGGRGMQAAIQVEGRPEG
jgi:hypothetical protein